MCFITVYILLSHNNGIGFRQIMKLGRDFDFAHSA